MGNMMMMHLVLHGKNPLTAVDLHQSKLTLLDSMKVEGHMCHLWCGAYPFCRARQTMVCLAGCRQHGDA
jgi:hypothetical protein